MPAKKSRKKPAPKPAPDTDIILAAMAVPYRTHRLPSGRAVDTALPASLDAFEGWTSTDHDDAADWFADTLGSPEPSTLGSGYYYALATLHHALSRVAFAREHPTTCRTVADPEAALQEARAVFGGVAFEAQGPVRIERADLAALEAGDTITTEHGDVYRVERDRFVTLVHDAGLFTRPRGRETVSDFGDDVVRVRPLVDTRTLSLF